MGRTRSSTWIGVAVLTIALCLLSVGSVVAAEKAEIRIGAINSISGPNAMNGAEQKWAYEQAVADVNKKGGVFVKDLNKKLPIKLIFADDKSVPDQAAAAMERLIKIEKVDFAMSSSVIPLNVAGATVCEKYKVYFAMTCTWLDEVEKQNFKWATDFFFTGLSAAEVPFVIWKGLPENEKILRPAIMMQDNMDGQGFGGAFKKWAKDYGYTIVSDEPYAPGAKDFSSQILKMKGAKADAVLWFGSPTDAITFVRQAKEQQLKLRYIHGWMGFWTPEFLKALGKDSNYIIHDGFWAETMPYVGAKELGQRFKKKFNKDSVSVGLYYANPQILAMAIEKAGSTDSAKVRDFMFSGKAEFTGTMMGDLKFSEKGLAFVPSLALQWWNGDRMPVYPPSKTWKLKMIPE
jgi:branched-chain amino acid transport system substrate-binding protein